MVPMLILYFYRKLKRTTFYETNAPILRRLVAQVLMALIVLAFTNSRAWTAVNGPFPSTKSITYKVIKKDNVIGSITIDQYSEGNKVKYEINSEINAQFIFKVHVVGKELSVFENGMLVYSKIFRQLNNKVKVDKALSYNDTEGYNLKTLDGNERPKLQEIKENLVTLFFKEPKNIKFVFCDNQTEMVPVNKIRDGVYRVQIADSKYNIYHYEQGRCVKMEAFSPLFKVILIPKM